MSKAEKFIRKQLNPAPSWTRQSVVFDFDDLCKYAEAYADQEHQRRLEEIIKRINNITQPSFSEILNELKQSQ